MAFLTGMSVFAQVNNDKGKTVVIKENKGYFYETIMKEINAVDDSLAKVNEQPLVLFKMDQSGMDLPNDPSLYQAVWSQPVISQGQTGTCWSYSTTAFYETEVYRLTGKEVTISEMYTVY